MFKSILGTALTRFLNAIFTLLILVVNANSFGKEGMGTIGLLVLGITLILLLSNYIGGGALVYLSPRIDIFKLFFPSYVWAGISSVLGAILLSFFHLIPVEYTFDVLFLALLQAFISTNQNILLGKQKILWFNMVTIVQVGLTLSALLVFIYVVDIKDVTAYIYALYLAYLAAFLLSLSLIYKYIHFSDITEIGPVLSKIFRYGKFIQTANVLQLLNYRLSFYIIEFFIGRAALGLYNTATQLSEGVWLIGKSVAMIQYSSISNSDDKDYARRLSLRLLKFTFVFTLLILFVLLIIPSDWYSLVFSADFRQLKMIMLTLALGIMATACSMMFSHYFSGTGRPGFNMIGSGIGLVFTLVLGLVFIPVFGIVAAGLTASVAYLMNMAYLLYMFCKVTGSGVKDFLINKEDVMYFRKEVLRLFKTA